MRIRARWQIVPRRVTPYYSLDDNILALEGIPPIQSLACTTFVSMIARHNLKRSSCHYNGIQSAPMGATMFQYQIDLFLGNHKFYPFEDANPIFSQDRPTGCRTFQKGHHGRYLKHSLSHRCQKEKCAY